MKINNDSLPPPNVLLDMVNELQERNKALTSENFALIFNLKQLCSLVDFLLKQSKSPAVEKAYKKVEQNLINLNTLTPTYYMGKNNPEKRP